MRVIDHLDKIDENDCHKTRGFLVIITKHIAIDMYRKQKKEHALSYDELEYMVSDPGESPENENFVLKAIGRLPVNDSNVLHLKFTHGYTNEEIARMLNVTEEAVRQRISRARKRLAKILEEEQG